MFTEDEKNELRQELKYNILYQFGKPECHEFYLRVMLWVRSHNLLHRDFFNDYARTLFFEGEEE